MGTGVTQAGPAQGSLKEHWGKCRVLGWQVKNGDLGSQQSLFYSRQRASPKWEESRRFQDATDIVKSV